NFLVNAATTRVKLVKTATSRLLLNSKLNFQKHRIRDVVCDIEFYTMPPLIILPA
ncbi:hypothetical protein KI387_004791, partial [Taxus chinensis]